MASGDQDLSQMVQIKYFWDPLQGIGGPITKAKCKEVEGDFTRLNHKSTR